MEDYYDDLPLYEAKGPEDVQHDAQVLIDSYIGPVEARTPSGLPMPFCLPQTGTGFDAPFARGYGQALEQVGISQKTFLDFLDGLNMAMIASPPLQVVNVAGFIVGFVPHWTFMLAGALMQAGAQVGMHVLSKTLSDRYLRAANERMFAPLGLRVRLCKTPALRKLVDHPEAGKEEPSKLKKFGQSAGDVVLRLPFPLMKKAARFFMDKHPPIDARITDPLTRRLMFMQGYILPVEHGPAIPPPSKPDKVLDKMNGFAVGRKRGKTNRKARDVAVRREILAGMPVSRRNYIMTMMKTRGSSQRLQTKVEDDARREHRANEKLVWLVIINEADDAKIAGKEAVDDSSDNIAFSDEQLEETREVYLEESDGNDYELEDYNPEPKASGSNSKADGSELIKE